MASVTKKPDRDVYCLSSPKRGSSGSRQYTFTWAISDWAKNSNNEARIEGYEIWVELGCYNIDTGATKKMTYKRTTSTTSTTSWTIDLNNFKLNANDSKTYTRADFYPANGWWGIRTITAKVRTTNSKGKGNWVTSTREMQQPRKPTIDFSQNASTGVVTWTVTHNKGEDDRENYTTRVMHEVFDSSRAEGSQVLRTGDTDDPNTPNFGTNTTTYTGNFDVYNRMGKTYEQYCRITVKAWSRGWWGASEHVKKEYYVSWPMEPQITGVRVRSKDSNGLVTIDIDTHYRKGEGTTNPVTGVRLCALVDSTYAKASDIPGSAWDSSTETSIVDNGSCTALSSTVSQLKPSAGNHTYLRVKAWNNIEDMFNRYSKVYTLDELYTAPASAQDDDVTIAAIQSGDDGKSMVLTLGWNDDDSTGTEVSWSTNENAWRSTEEPDSSQFTWDDGPATVSGVSYDNVAVLHVMGLDEGTLYHFRARRYLETDSGTEYGPYCPTNATVTGIPSTSPSSASLSAPQYVSSGSALDLSWSYDSDATQKSWEIITGTVTTTTVGGISHKNVTGNVTIVANGDDALGSCRIPWDVWSAKASGGTLPLAVRVSTGGNPVTSDAVVVTVAEKPTVAASLGTVSDQPISIGLTCSKVCDVAIVILSQYAEQVLPDGRLTQVSGDCVLSVVQSPTWTSGNDGYTATVELTENMALIDLCSYTLQVVATEPVTGMSSDVYELTFTVDYSTKAVQPSTSITVTPSDTTDEGVRTRGATIALAAPTGRTTDVYDIYRLTHDGASLCAKDVPLTATVFDRYAPFGTGVTAYRVALRTANGSVDWRDITYTFGPQDVFTREIRIDFGDGYVETARGVSVSEKWKKDVEIREHLDGSRTAYWNEAVARTGSIAAASIRVYERAVDEAFRRLASYPNVVFVRTSEGLAFRANVDVSIDTPSFTAGENVSLSFSEVTSESYMAEVE